MEEIPNSAHTVTAASTASTAFVDYFPQGPIGEAVQIDSFESFTRTFGGLDAKSEASYAIYQYFANGGRIAWVVRLGDGEQKSAAVQPPITVAMPSSALTQVAAESGDGDEDATEGPVLTVTAANPGTWGNSLQVTIAGRSDHNFDLKVEMMGMVDGVNQSVATESYSGLTLADPRASNFAPTQVNDTSQLIRIAYPGPYLDGVYPVPSQMPQELEGGADGGLPTTNNLFPATDSDGPGLAAPLEHIAPDSFNILCLPVVASYSDSEMSSALTQALELVEQQFAFLIVDIPQRVDTVDKMEQWMGSFSNAGASFAAVYYPRLLMPDPLQDDQSRNVGPSGTLAGLYAGNDEDYGVWESPAGMNAMIQGAQPAVPVTDDESGDLNVLGVNCLRTFPTSGPVVWGGRTMAGADLLDSEWKYISVRRVANYIENSLSQSLKWVVFETNDERLWSQIRAEVNGFMAGLYAQGAFAGASATQAFLVECDSSTTTQTDIDNGIVNVLVGFAPEKPAEFVIIQLQQLTGQSTI